MIELDEVTYELSSIGPDRSVAAKFLVSEVERYRDDGTFEIPGPWP